MKHLNNFKYVIGAALILALAYFAAHRSSDTKPAEEVGEKKTELARPDVNNIKYNVDGDIFTLKNGSAEKESLPGSAMIDSLEIFGDSVYSDFDADGDLDAAVWLMNDPGGTGKFYYAALVINKNGVPTSTNAILLGDRIAPQTLEVKGTRALYNFMERKPTDPMTATPSVGKSLYLSYNKSKGTISSSAK